MITAPEYTKAITALTDLRDAIVRAQTTTTGLLSLAAEIREDAEILEHYDGHQLVMTACGLIEQADQTRGTTYSRELLTQAAETMTRGINLLGGVA